MVSIRKSNLSLCAKADVFGRNLRMGHLEVKIIIIVIIIDARAIRLFAKL